MINTLSQARALFDCIKPMEPFPTIRLTRQEIERAALDLGANFSTVRQWRYRGISMRWQIHLMKHFAGFIVIDDVASANLPPVNNALWLTFVARTSSHLRGLHEVYYEAPMYAGDAQPA